jgi:hypothetical protein
MARQTNPIAPNHAGVCRDTPLIKGLDEELPLTVVSRVRPFSISLGGTGHLVTSNLWGVDLMIPFRVPRRAVAYSKIDSSLKSGWWYSKLSNRESRNKLLQSLPQRLILGFDSMLAQLRSELT